MTTEAQTDERALGRLEANVENLQASVAELRTNLQSSVGEIRLELQQTNVRIDQTNSRIDQTNGKIDKLFYATIGIGGGVIAALIALILRGT